MARHWNPIMMNAVLFGRIALLRDNRASLGLTGEQIAAPGAHLYAFPPRRRRARRGGRRGWPGSTSGWPTSARPSATICSATNRTGSWNSARPIATAFRTASSQRRNPPPMSAAWLARRS